jgi:hypothetical protein
MGEEVRIWYDKEGDYLEVLFDRKAKHFREAENDAVMEKVDSQGNILDSAVLKVSALSDQRPLSFSLKKRSA